MTQEDSGTGDESGTVRIAGLSLPTVIDTDYPADVDPHPHQLELRRRIVNDEQTGAFVNEAPTGAGKTLSWVVPAAELRLDTIAVYPTNALIGDQARAIEGAETEPGLLDEIEEDLGDDITVLPVTSERLDKRGSDHGKVLGGMLREAFADRSAEAVFVLTNPDTLALLARRLYHHRIEQFRRFDFAVVDEFHRAGRKERNTLLFILDEWNDEYGVERVAFLSATPENRLRRRLRAATDMNLTRVGTGNAEPYGPGSLSDGYRAIMPPATMEVFSSAPFNTAEKIVGESSVLDLKAFCAGERTVLILDGLHEVDVVHRALAGNFDGTVERIDGFHRGEVEAILNRFDVLVSNSAVEVGVDFEVGRLLFSAISPSAFVQRLGRLRNRREEADIRAVAPPGVAGRLLDDAKRRSEQWIPRNDFGEIVREAYPTQHRAPSEFDHRYSAIEAYEHVRRRCHDAPSQMAERIEERGFVRIARHFFEPHDIPFSPADVERLRNAHTSGGRSNLVDKLLTYRGESIDAAVFEPEGKSVKTYRLPYLLRWGNVEFMPEDRFVNSVPDEVKRKARNAVRNAEGGYCIYRGGIEASKDGYGRSILFKSRPPIEAMLNRGPTTREPEVMAGVEIEAEAADNQPRIRGASHMKDVLEEAEVLTYATAGRPTAIKRRYGLPADMFLYPLSAGAVDSATVAFGHDALYLHSWIEHERRGRDREERW